MCGIAGILYFDKNRSVQVQHLDLMRESLVHRGPDFGANYLNNNIGLAHRRLSIIDLSDNGNQPMISDDGRFVLIYNGEIYNFQELKTELLEQGEKFFSNSDTEVLLKLFLRFGEEMLDKINGMFSFAVWDNLDKKLFLARDRVGMKPLFYFNDSEKFIFASEVKSLIKFGLPININEEGLNEFLVFRHIAGESTIFNGIKKILPGYSCIIHENGNINKKRWWNLKQKIQSSPTISNPIGWFQEVFNRSVKSHMISDVPVGVLLSGGLDSGSICASLAKQEFNRVQTFNVGFNFFSEDESLQAEFLANHFNFTFRSIRLEHDELLENLSIVNYVNDEPIIHQNEPQLLAISRLAQKNVTVLLSGEGADEFLGGYVRYKPLEFVRYQKLIKGFLSLIPSFAKSSRFKKLERYFSIKDINGLLLFNSVNNYPTDFFKMGINTTDIHISYREGVLKEARELYPNSLQRQMMYLDQHTYLNSLNDRNDRCTMAASVECRMPFLDTQLMIGIGTLDDKWFFNGKTTKILLRESFKDLLPKRTLRFRKVGFAVPWIDMILHTPPLKNHWNEMHNSDIMQYGLLQFLDIKLMQKEFEKGNKTNEFLLRHLFFISLWWKQFNEQHSFVSLAHA